MIKLSSFTKRFFLQPRLLYSFSSLADPYYILGVDKSTPYPEIKRAFYKLANQFHPDKNDTQQAQKKFVIIKQAFESIKMEKGLMKVQNLYRSQDRESMRPNPEKYATQDSENMKNFRDYTVFSEKANSNEEYDSFNNSFKTIKDINEIKIKVEAGQMKDPTSRFSLDKYKAKISSYSQSGNKYFFVIMTGLTIFTIVTNQVFNEKESQTKQSALKRLTQIHKRKTIETELVENRKIDLKNIQSLPQIQQMKNKYLLEDIKGDTGKSLISDKVIAPSRMNSV